MAAGFPRRAHAGGNNPTGNNGTGRDTTSRVLQLSRNDARHIHGLFRDHAVVGGSVWELSDSAENRGARHGLSKVEHGVVLDCRSRGNPHACRILCRGWPRGGRVDCIRAALSRPGMDRREHGTAAMASQPGDPRLELHTGRNELHLNHRKPAGTGDDVVQATAFNLGAVHYGDSSAARDTDPLGCRNHAVLRPDDRYALL